MTDVFTVTRTFAASPELVWSAWTTPKHFSIWFGAEAEEVPLSTLTLDVRVGGALSAVIQHPDGRTIDWLGEYTQVDPPSRLAFTLTDDPSSPPGEPITVDLMPMADDTELTLTQTVGKLTAEQVARAKAGYHRFFDDMDKVIASLL